MPDTASVENRLLLPDKFNILTLKINDMQGEDDLRGLAKIMAFMRAVSILLVLMHYYWYCYPFFSEKH